MVKKLISKIFIEKLLENITKKYWIKRQWRNLSETVHEKAENSADMKIN